MIYELCLIHLECSCDPRGSNSTACDKEGMCKCRSNVNGPKCDECSDGFYNFPECKGNRYCFMKKVTFYLNLLNRM